MNVTRTTAKSKMKPAWRENMAPYQSPSLKASLWQVVNTFVPYFVLLFLMYLSLDYSYWITLALAVPAGGLLVRVFIIFHDCGHGSFFKSRKWNDLVGSMAGLLCFTPYYQWRHHHAIHHATSGDLDRRGTGDIYTLTVREYLAMSRWGRLKYRLFRNPLIMLGLIPLFNFLVLQRFTVKEDRRKERLSVYGTNLAIILVLVVMWLTIGLKDYFLVQLPVAAITATLGVWLFYVQHQFEGTYWESGEEWDYVTASLKGSSYFKLPKVLQWFTGNIGLHHVHHLNARIPNYYLQACHDQNEMLQDVTTITLWSSIKSLGLKLWDEEQRRLVGWKHLKTLQVQPNAFPSEG